MPTQEERLAALEKTTAASIIELNENAAMTIGLVKRQSYEISRISSDIKNIREILDIRFDAANAHLDFLQAHADRTDKKLSEIKQELTETKTLLTQILNRLPEKP